MPKPFIGALQTVENQWTDYNGHLNMAYYAVMFDKAAEHLFWGFGLGPDYVKQTNCSFFTLETHTTYIHEIHAGDIVRIENQIIDADHKRVHYVQHMRHASEGWIACITENIVMHVDLANVVQLLRVEHAFELLPRRCSLEDLQHQRIEDFEVDATLVICGLAQKRTDRGQVAKRGVLGRVNFAGRKNPPALVIADRQDA